MLPILLALSPAHATPDLSLAYHGHVLTHPGAAARLAWRSERRWALQPELETGLWVHPRHQLALYARGGAALSHHGPRDGLHELFVHVGGQRSTFLVPTYEVGDDVQRAPFAGRWWGTATAGIGLGRGAWFVRPQLTLRAPYFHGLGTDFAVQIGARLGGRA